MSDKKVTELFGSMVFNEEVMKQRLSTTCYRAWKKCVKEGTPRDSSSMERSRGVFLSRAWPL